MCPNSHVKQGSHISCIWCKERRTWPCCLGTARRQAEKAASNAFVLVKPKKKRAQKFIWSGTDKRTALSHTYTHTHTSHCLAVTKPQMDPGLNCLFNWLGHDRKIRLHQAVDCKVGRVCWKIDDSVLLSWTSSQIIIPALNPWSITILRQMNKLLL